MKYLYVLTLIVAPISVYGTAVLKLDPSPSLAGPDITTVVPRKLKAADEDVMPRKLKAADLSGYYHVTGTQSGKSYEGMASIISFGSLWIVDWQMPAGSTVRGFGMFHDNLFSVSWCTEGGKTRGINVYELRGTTLKGRWAALPGSGKIMTETLTLLRRHKQAVGSDTD